MPSGQFPGFLAGQVLTAALMNEATPLFAYKTGDTSRVTTTTLANDPDLSVSVAANATYAFELFLNYEGSTQGSSDMKFAFTGPTGFSMSYQLNGISTAGAWQAGFLRGASGGTLGTNGAGNKFGATLIGTVTTSTTPGTLAFQWAQNTSNGVATIVHAQSLLALLRFA